MIRRGDVGIAPYKEIGGAGEGDGEPVPYGISGGAEVIGGAMWASPPTVKIGGAVEGVRKTRPLGMWTRCGGRFGS
jgi:hypothetical protein